MHIVLGLLGALGTLVFLIYRINLGLHASRELAENIGDLRRMGRRSKWLNKASTPTVMSVADPREAAVVLMISVAKLGHDMIDTLPREEQQQLVEDMQRLFSMSPDDAAGLLSHMMFMTKDTVDAGGYVPHLVEVICKACTVREQQQLVAVLSHIAERYGSPPLQRQLVQSVQHNIKVRA